MHDFAILEYRDTIGGRAWHKPFGKDKDGKPYVIEMGANWVRYEACNVVYWQIAYFDVICRSKALEIPVVLKIPYGAWYVTSSLIFSRPKAMINEFYRPKNIS